MLRTGLLCATVVCGIAAVALAIGSIVTHVLAHNLTANLRLADDASTAEMKAEFLRRLIQDLQTADLAEHAAWFIKNEQNKTENQIAVLKSLLQRCEETAALDRSSFGYAQGMQQITGQEFDHALDSVQLRMQKAYLVTWPWLLVSGWIPAVVAGVTCALALRIGRAQGWRWLAWHPINSLGPFLGCVSCWVSFTG